MSSGERLLDLVLEYDESKRSRSDEFGPLGTPVGREPEAIAADYERELRSLLT